MYTPIPRLAALLAGAALVWTGLGLPTDVAPALQPARHDGPAPRSDLADAPHLDLDLGQRHDIQDTPAPHSLGEREDSVSTKSNVIKFGLNGRNTIVNGAVSFSIKAVADSSSGVLTFVLDNLANADRGAIAKAYDTPKLVKNPAKSSVVRLASIAIFTWFTDSPTGAVYRFTCTLSYTTESGPGPLRLKALDNVVINSVTQQLRGRDPTPVPLGDATEPIFSAA